MKNERKYFWIFVCCFFNFSDPLLQAGEISQVRKELQTNPLIHPAASWVLENQLTITHLKPAPNIPGLCVYHYRVTTTSKECQQLVDQALGYYYSYVWMEAARSFETALRYDHECAFAWLGLSKSIEKWGRGNGLEPLKKAHELMKKAGHRESLLILSRCQEKGIADNVKPDQRKSKAQSTLDELLTLYEDDEEGWFARAQISDRLTAIPYYKSLLRVNPLHPGANHELVHFYENYTRPVLGWPYAEKYIESSPGIPHAFHMQAHLAMRIGKWDKTSDRSSRAIELEQQYHQHVGVPPKDDFQFQHHLETLTRSLIHDGRFSEVNQTIEVAKKENYDFHNDWFRMYLLQENWSACEAIISKERKKNKDTAIYHAALLFLTRGESSRAKIEIDALRQIHQKRGHRNAKLLDLRLRELQGRWLCQQNQGEAGLKLLQEVVNQTKNDFNSHAWGMGSYWMESWGLGALEAGNDATAEEAFLEALAHDARSIMGALGLRALCEKLHREDESQQYELLARRCWPKASESDYFLLRSRLDRLTKRIAGQIKSPTTQNASGAVSTGAVPEKGLEKGVIKQTIPSSNSSSKIIPMENR